ncbi:MAG: hypothetical protein AAF533_17995 [Acidobacteriota bacterium]
MFDNRRAHVVLAALALTLAACGGGGSPKTDAPSGEGATPATAPAPTTQTSRRPANAPTPVPGLKPSQAKGVTQVEVSLSKAVTLGGIQLDLGYASDRFVAGEPVLSDSLNGYLSAANPNEPGLLQWSCAGMGQSAVQTLATIPIHYRDAAPTLSDIKVLKADLVDPSARAIEGVEVELRLK